MNTFVNRAIWAIKNQTGAELLECKTVFDRTHSIKASIDYLRLTSKNVKQWLK